jgi:O-antigen ligase
MREDRINLDVIDVPLSRFDKVIEWLLISLLAFMPLAFGAVEAWSEEVVVALAAAISVCFLLKLIFEENTRVIWSWAYIPVALFILIAVFQLIPLPGGAVSVISPGTAAVKKGLLSDLPNSGVLLKSMTLSFYSNATKHDMRLVLAVAVVFFVVVNVYRRADQIKRLLAAIAIIGGSIAVLALAQDLLGNGKIYWIVSTGYGEAFSGTFINHSHYGQFMNLSIGAALGLIMVKVHEAFTGKKVTPPLVFEYLSSPAAKVIWLLLAMIVVGAATVFVSLTRGAMVSMLIAAGFTTLVLSSRQSLKGRNWIMALMALGAFICVLYIGFDAVYDRLATLRELHEYHGRWQIVKDIGVAWTKFPVFGTGLGTHEVVYPMFDRSTIASLAAHAENEYAQAAEETGLVGLIALVCFGILVWANYVRNVRSASVLIRSAAYGLGFGLVGIMLHSLSDFGQHLPANAFLSGVSCALLLALARMGQKDNPTTKAAKASQVSRSLRIAVLVCASGVWVWALLGANSARLAEAHWKKALAVEQSLMEKDWLGSDEEYIDLISNAAAAADYQPDNVKYQHWLNVYRWESISRITDPNTGAVIIPEQTMEFVRRIVDELHNARTLCPTYGATYCVVGQLEKFTLDDPNGAEHIRKGLQLAPCDPTACFVAGLLDAEEQQIDASFEKFSRAIQLDGRFFQGVADVYINHVGRLDLAVAIAGDNTGWLSRVANTLAGMEEHKDIVEKAQARVVDLLREKCSGPDAPAWALASLANICRKEKDNEAAIEYYRRALALDYSQVYWRLALARLLAEMDKIPEASHEARICLRLQPQMNAAKKLIEDLSVLPGAVSEDK